MKKERRETILAAAVTVAARKHYATITREEIAKAAGCAAGLVSYYFGGMKALRSAVMRAAVAKTNLVIISQGLGNGDAYARKVPPSIKAEALKLLAR